MLGLVLERARSGRSAPGGSVARAVIIAIDGSTRRRVGSELVLDDGGLRGSFGGGPTEAQVIEVMHELRRNGGPEPWRRRLLVIPQGPILGEPVSGSTHVLIEIFGPAEMSALSRLVGGAAREGACLARSLQEGAPPVVVVLADRTPAKVDEIGITKLLPRLQARPDLPLIAELPAGGRGGLLVERLGSALVALHIHGRGEVALALARVLEGTPFRTYMHDPGHDPGRESPPDIVADQPSFHAVLTGSHELDVEVCRVLLGRNGVRYLGLIGSPAKRNGAIEKLVAGGIPRSRAETIVCPIGLESVRGKEPAVIAIAIAAQLIAVLRAPPCQ